MHEIRCMRRTPVFGLQLCYLNRRELDRPYQRSTLRTKELWLWMGIMLVCLAPYAMAEDPTPEPWPRRFHALLYANFSGTIGVEDLYYDWDNGRNLLLIRNQLKPVLHDMQWQNGKVFKWEVGGECNTFEAGVGLLPPNWLEGATYLGRQEEDGFTVNVWTKVDFIVYREDVVTKTPVGWTYSSGRDMHVISFHPGFILGEEGWQVPVECFSGEEKLESSVSATQERKNSFAGVKEWMLGGSASA